MYQLPNPNSKTIANLTPIKNNPLPIQEGLNVLTFDNEIQINDSKGDTVTITGIKSSDVTITQSPKNIILEDPLSVNKQNNELKSMPTVLPDKPIIDDPLNIPIKPDEPVMIPENIINNTYIVKSEIIKKESSCSPVYFWIFVGTVLITILISVFIGYNGFTTWYDCLYKCPLIINKWVGLILFGLSQFISSIAAYRSFAKCNGASRWITVIFYIFQAIFSILWVALLFGYGNIKGAIIFAGLYLITIIMWIIYLSSVDIPSVGLLILNLLWGIYILLATIELYRLNRCRCDAVCAYTCDNNSNCGEYENNYSDNKYYE